MAAVTAVGESKIVSERERTGRPGMRALSAIDEFFELSPDAMIIVSRGGKLVAANAAAGHLFGCPAEELIGQAFGSLFTEEPSRRLSLARRSQPKGSEYASPLCRHATAHFQLEGRKKAGTPFPTDLTLTPLTGSMATLTLVVVRDASSSSSTESTVALAASRATSQAITGFQQELLVELARGHGIGGIAAAINDRTGRKVLILDAVGGILASAGYGAVARVPQNRIIRGQISSPHGVRERHGDCWTVPVRPDQSLLGRISVFDPAGDMAENELLALEQAASIVASELLRLRSITDSEASRLSEFANELIEAPASDRLSSIARSLEFDLDQTHWAVAIEAVASAGNRIELVEHVARGLGVRAPLVTSRGERTVLLLPDELPWERLATALSSAFGARARIGIGGEYQLVEVQRSLAEAMFALELGAVVHSAKPVTTFGDLGVWTILVDSSEPAKLKEFVHEWIGPLIDYDKAHSSELVKSLTSYLKESCATEAAAAALYVHRNTLRYRLSKVAQITRRDLGDADQRFQLELACRAWVVLQALEGAER